MGKIREACGRCSMTSVVDVAESDEEGGSNPFDGDRIEVSETAIRKVAFPAVWLGHAKTRLDKFATGLTYGTTEGERDN